MMISKRPFGTLADGTVVSAWTLVNGRGLRAEVLDYGVIIRSVIIPDRKGKPVDVVLGYDTLEDYVSDRSYLGATVGRCANRIKDASFELNGKTHQLSANFGPHHLHGGKMGFHKCVWNAEEREQTVVFSRVSADGEEGYPGNLQVRVTVGWQEDALTIGYEAQTDQDTLVNLTNHSYFNLNGAGSGNIHRHLLQIRAEQYTSNGADGFPTGEMLPVEGTAMDFRAPKPLGQDIGFFGGYDTNFVLAGHPAAAVEGNKTGIRMVVDTDRPGMQLYTAPPILGRRGKDGKRYGHHGAFCLETQYHPDSIHHPQWPTCILRAGEIFRSFTSYAFE